MQYQRHKVNVQHAKDMSGAAHNITIRTKIYFCTSQRKHNTLKKYYKRVSSVESWIDPLK